MLNNPEKIIKPGDLHSAPSKLEKQNPDLFSYPEQLKNQTKYMKQ